MKKFRSLTMPKRKDKKKSLDYNKEKISLLFELNKKLISEIEENREVDSISSMFTIEEILSDPFLKEKISLEIHLKKMTMASTDKFISLYQKNLEAFQRTLDRKEKKYQYELEQWQNRYNGTYCSGFTLKCIHSSIETAKRDIELCKSSLKAGKDNLKIFNSEARKKEEDYLQKQKNFLMSSKEDLKRLIEHKESIERDQIKELEKKPKPSLEMISLKRVINRYRETIKKLREDPNYIYRARYAYEVGLYVLREQMKKVASFYLKFERKY